MGRLSGVIVDIEGVKALVDFEFIQIIDDSDPYATLLGLDWAIDMDAIINLKHRSMVFENNETMVVVPLDPAEGERYTKLVHTEEDVEHIYKLTTRDEDWINPTPYGWISWDRDSSCQQTQMRN